MLTGPVFSFRRFRTFTPNSLGNTRPFPFLILKETDSTWGSFMLANGTVISRITVSFAVGIALLSATVRLPATPCLVTNTPAPKACEMDCCRNQKCCETSPDRTGPVSPPLATSSSGQQNIVALPAVSATTRTVRDWPKLDFVPRAKMSAHLPAPTLALLCTFLI